MAIIPSSPIKKAKFKHSTPKRRNRIIARYSSGITAKAVAVHEGVTEVHVRGVIKRFTHQDWGVSKPGRGRPPVLNERDKRAILREVTKSPFISVESLRRIACPHVSRSSLSRYLKKEGIGHHLAATRPYLSNEAASSRYAWALEYHDKDLSFWRTVLFTDESIVEKGGGGRRSWVFRPKGKKRTPVPNGNPFFLFTIS